MYDDLQFTLGEGPCLDSVTRRIPILVVDLADPEEARWPAYRPAMLAHRVRSVYAIPVVVAGEFVGTLDLFRAQPGPLPGEDLVGAVAAAELAAIPLLDLLDADLQAAVADPTSNAWAKLNTLSRSEVSQATGMLVAQLEVEPAEAPCPAARSRLRHRPQHHRRRPRHARPPTEARGRLMRARIDRNSPGRRVT
jgi:hypothetical protein